MQKLQGLSHFQWSGVCVLVQGQFEIKRGVGIWRKRNWFLDQKKVISIATQSLKHALGVTPICW